MAVYNTAEYLETCINSLLNQTLDDIEIILVDDGSSDQSSIICDSYAKADKRVKCIHQKNCGPSIARNNGISIARGKYIAFVDSDDWVENDMYQILYNAIESEGAELAVAGYCREWPEGQTEYDVIDLKNEIVDVERIGLLNYFCKYWIGFRGANYVWNKLYSKDLFTSKDLCFPEDMKFAEDRFLNYLIIPYIKKAVHIKKNLYHYVQRYNSAVYTSAKTQNLFYSQLDVYFRTVKFWKKVGIYSVLEPIAPVFICRIIQGAIYSTRKAGCSSGNVARSAMRIIKGKKNVQKYLFLATFGPSVTYYRRIIGLETNEEFKMRGFAISCLLGEKALNNNGDGSH